MTQTTSSTSNDNNVSKMSENMKALAHHTIVFQRALLKNLDFHKFSTCNTTTILNFIAGNEP